MRGPNAEVSANIMRKPNKIRTTIIGVIHHFLLVLRYNQSSFNISMICFLDSLKLCRQLLNGPARSYGRQPENTMAYPD